MRALLLGLVALAFAAPALAPAAMAQVKDESVLTPLPEGSKLGYRGGQPGFAIAEIIPANETVEDWSVMVTQLTFATMPATLDAFAEGMAQRYADACGAHEMTKIVEDLTNGYPSGLWRLVCGINPGTGKPEYMYMKLVRGADAFYSIQYAYRDVPSPERNAAAETYMLDVSVCDPRTPYHPCPAAVTVAAPG